MRRWFARRVLSSRERLVHRTEEDGTQYAAVVRGDQVVFYHGKQNIRVYAVSARNAVDVARFVARWWVLGMWCGLRARLWDWALGVSLKRDGD